MKRQAKTMLIKKAGKASQGAEICESKTFARPIAPGRSSIAAKV